MGMAYLEKTRGFNRNNDWLQTLRYAELALTKLKLLKDRSLAFIEILDEALRCKYDALNFMNLDKEALECATERYNMWATTNIRNPRTIEASFPLIESLIENNEFDHAQLIAHTIYEMAMHPMTHGIPENNQQSFLAKAAFYVTHATVKLAQTGSIPLEEKQKAAKDAIVFARQSLEIRTQLHGVESNEASVTMNMLAFALEYSNDVYDDDDDEALCLYERLILLNSRLKGSSSVAVARYKQNLGKVYNCRAIRAVGASDLDRCLVNLALALPHYYEAIRIFRENNHMESANDLAQKVTDIEGLRRQVIVENAERKAAAAAEAIRG